MAPNRENLMMNSSSSSSSSRGSENKTNKKAAPRLSMESLQRSISDISLELMSTKEARIIEEEKEEEDHVLQAISEVEEAKCECCGMSEECTAEYIRRLRDDFSGKLICGLCAEAVGEEMIKNKGLLKRDDALKEHMKACSRFNKLGRTYPLLYQADAIKEILKKTTRAKSFSHRDHNINKGTSTSSTPHQRKSSTGLLTRSSSCIPAIIRKDQEY